MSVPVYTPNGWVDDDGSGTVGTPYTAARMNHIEAGIRDAAILPATLAAGAPDDTQRVSWRRASDGVLLTEIDTQQAQDPGATGDSGLAATLTLLAHLTGNWRSFIEQRIRKDDAAGFNERIKWLMSNDESLSSGKRSLAIAYVNDAATAFVQRLILDSAGQSDFATSMGSFKVGLASALSVGTSATVVPYTDKSAWGGFDHDNWWDSTNFRYNPKRAGYYVFNTSWRIAGTPASGNTLWAAVYKNGSPVSFVPASSLSGAANPGGGATFFPMLLNGTTDYVDLRLNMGSSSFNMSVDASTNWFAGRYIGA